MPDEPAFGDRTIEACSEVVTTAASFEERRVDQLNVDPAILHRLDRTGDFDQFDLRPLARLLRSSRGFRLLCAAGGQLLFARRPRVPLSSSD